VKTTVPVDIRDQFLSALGRESELWSLSSSRSRSGEPGETWIVATQTRLLVGDRGFGGPVSIREIPLRSITGIELEGASFGAGRVVLVGKHGALDHVCFSSLERDDFVQLGDRVRSAAGEAPPAEALVVAAHKKAVPAAEIPFALPAETTRGSAPPRRNPLPPRPGRVPSSGAFDLFLDHPWAFPGRPLNGVLRLHWPAAKAVRGVRLFWKGLERTHMQVGSGKRRRTVTSRWDWVSESIGCFGQKDPIGILEAIGDAMSGRAHPVLAAGVHEYPFEFSVPKGSPGTYAGRHVNVTYELFAQVDIPRGFDLTARYPVRVVPTPQERTGGGERKHSQSLTLRGWVNAGPTGPGVPLTGGFRVTNPAGKSIRAAHVQVLRKEYAQAGNHSRATEFLESALAIPGQSIGVDDVPFTIPLPESFCPWDGRYSSVGYAVKVWLDVAWAFDVQVEIGL
jgi:hypothetical protein